MRALQRPLNVVSGAMMDVHPYTDCRSIANSASKLSTSR
jgi:hypothetical protein